MATLYERQCRNRWAKKTYNCDINEYFRRAPPKLKARIKKFIVEYGYHKHNSYLPSTIYECYGVDVSHKLCNELIDHYTKGNQNETRILHR